MNLVKLMKFWLSLLTERVSADKLFFHFPDLFATRTNLTCLQIRTCLIDQNMCLPVKMSCHVFIEQKSISGLIGDKYICLILG